MSFPQTGGELILISIFLPGNLPSGAARAITFTLVTNSPPDGFADQRKSFVVLNFQHHVCGGTVGICANSK
jgi:hypothetical protein